MESLKGAVVEDDDWVPDAVTTTTRPAGAAPSRRVFEEDDDGDDENDSFDEDFVDVGESRGGGGAMQPKKHILAAIESKVCSGDQ